MKSYSIEIAPEKRETCTCCGAAIYRLTFFVSEGENAFAVCYALLTPSHPHDPVKFAVSIGDWGGEEDTEFYPSRCCFTIWGRIVNGFWQFMARSAQDSPWDGNELLGRMLSREEALADENISDVWRVIDQLIEESSVLADFKASAKY